MICLYIFSHQDFHAHCASPARIDFCLRTLQVLKDDLAKLDIPLWVEGVTDRKRTQNHILDWCDKWGVGELRANMLYEVDELRRDAKLVREGVKKDLRFTVHHDTCVVEPMVLRSGTGKTHSVFTRFFKFWEPYVLRERDAQPYFQIFNSFTQSEKFDPEGEYIRRWVPELSKLKEKAIHSPAGRLSPAGFKKPSYPEPTAEHKAARERALERYKTGLGRNTP